MFGNIPNGILLTQNPVSNAIVLQVGSVTVNFEFDNSFLSQGVWHHFTLIRSASDPSDWNLYQDGINLSRTQLNQPSNPNANQRLFLGVIAPTSTGSNFQRPLIGAMTEFIAQKKEISQQEIQDRAIPKPASDLQNLIAYYKLNQESGGTVVDDSPNNNDIDLQGYTPGELAPGGGAWPHITSF